MAGSGGPPDKVKSLDVGPVYVSCQPADFIVSLNDDDDDGDGVRDCKEAITAQEDNLRRFCFDNLEAIAVRIDEPVLMQNGSRALNVRVRAYDSAGRPFDFGILHQTPVIMYLEGIKASKAVRDIGFQVHYYADILFLFEICTADVVGTVVDVKPKFSAKRMGGSAFQQRSKMLVTSLGKARAALKPANVGPTLWSYDGQATLATPASLRTDFRAGQTFTPVAQRDRHLLRFRVTRAEQSIEAYQPVNLTAAVHLTAEGRFASGFDVTTAKFQSAHGQQFTLIPTVGRSHKPVLIQYKILDQFRDPITESAYAGKAPQVRENIRSVLTNSNIEQVRTWIQSALHSTDQWKTKKNGKLVDMLQAQAIPKSMFTVSPGGRRQFHSSLQSVGGVFLSLSGNQSHEWQLSISGAAIHTGTRNSFSVTTAARQEVSGSVEVKIRSQYQVRTQ